MITMARKRCLSTSGRLVAYRVLLAKVKKTDDTKTRDNDDWAEVVSRVDSAEDVDPHFDPVFT